MARGPARELRPLADLAKPGPAGLVEVAEIEGWRAVRDAGAAGGPIDVLVAVPLIDGRVLDPAEGARTFEGVPVREVAALDGPLRSCFVGDFVGDLTILDGRDGLAAGVGLDAFKLRLLFRAASPLVDVLPAAGLKLLGRAGLRAAAAGFGAGCCAGGRMVAIMGLTNMP
jgi:hypothetical protein